MELLRKVERHLRATGTSASKFGRAVARDPQLIHDMRRGREVRSKMQGAIEDAIGARR